MGSSNSTKKPAKARPKTKQKATKKTKRKATKKIKPKISKKTKPVAETKPEVAETKIEVAETKIEVAETKPEVAETKPEVAETKPEVAEKQVPEKKPTEDLPKFEKSIADRIVSSFGTKAEIGFIRPNRIRINTKKEDIVEIAKYIRDELKFDHAESVSGVDYPDSKEIEVVYHLGSYTDPQLSKHILTLATRVPREDVPNPGKDNTKMSSLRDVFFSVEFHERECFEMLGVFFEGHPDNRRLLLPEDWADLPPLRKDFRIKGR